MCFGFIFCTANFLFYEIWTTKPETQISLKAKTNGTTNGTTQKGTPKPKKERKKKRKTSQRTSKTTEEFNHSPASWPKDKHVDNITDTTVVSTKDPKITDMHYNSLECLS